MNLAGNPKDFQNKNINAAGFNDYEKRRRDLKAARKSNSPQDTRFQDPITKPNYQYKDGSTFQTQTKSNELCKFFKAGA